MTEQHPITPPQWQVDAWRKQALAMGADVDAVFLEAARWGYEQRGADIEAKLQKARDEELEACCEEMKSIPSPLGIPFGEMASNALRAARRPKPPSLKEQALAVLDDASDRLDAAHENTIRRALESLPN